MSAAGEPVSGEPRPRPAAARARRDRDGIAAVEAFSRGDSIDAAWMGWGALRVLSRQDWAPGAVRDEGRVANMERLLLVLDGALDADCGACGRHRVEAGGVLWIGTGHGLASRLANASGDAALHLVEFWLQPDRVNAAPAAATWAPENGKDAASDAGGWTLVATGDGTRVDAALPLRQAARVLLASPGAGARISIPASAGSRCWLEVLSGAVVIDGGGSADSTAAEAGVRLAGGDGLGWLAHDAGRPAAFAAAGDGPARLLLLVLPA